MEGSRDSFRPGTAAEDEGKVLAPVNALSTPGTACTSSCYGLGCPPTPFTLLGKYSRHICSGSKHIFLICQHCKFTPAPKNRTVPCLLHLSLLSIKVGRQSPAEAVIDVM